jgi:hypothetical protein
MSCSDENDPDVYWAKRAAQATGATLEIVHVEKPVISEAYVRQLFDYADGLSAFLDDNYMRIRAFMLDRSDGRYTAYLTGDGGPRHKDWYWIQDLPFYRRRHTDVGRFYDQRIQVIRTSIPLGKRLESHYRGLRSRMVSSMQPYVMQLNTQSYDSIGFHVLGDLVKVKYSIHSRVVASYAPLWELELVRYSYHLPRKKRFYYNSMREIMTAHSKPLALTPTVYGTTASSELRYLARDVVFQGIDYLKKATRLVGRSLLHRNLFVGQRTTWSGESDVRALAMTRDAMEYCVKEDLIGPNTRQDEVTYATLGRMIQIYLLAEKLQQWKASDLASSDATSDGAVSQDVQ